MENLDKLGTAIVGLITGVGLTSLLAGIDTMQSRIEKARVIEKENVPRIMEFYNFKGANQILVEDPNNVGEYIRLSDYLKRFDDKYEKNLERTRIKFSVSQMEK